MTTEFSLFEGHSAYDLKFPMDYWRNFIDDMFATVEVESEIWHFHCCIIPKKEDLDKNDFLLDFFQKLPFTTMDKERNTIHFWWQTPELKILLQDEANTINADNIAIALLDSMYQLLLNKQKENKDFLKLCDLEALINKAKNEILQIGIIKIREKYHSKQERDFKNKYWI